MTLTPSSVRNDLKCGNGSISPGEKCTKGAASKAAPSSSRKRGSQKLRGTLETAARVIGTGGNLYYGVKGIGAVMSGDVQKGANYLQAQGAFSALQGAGELSAGMRTGNKELRKQGLQSLSGAAVGIGIGHMAGGSMLRSRPTALKNAGARLGAGLRRTTNRTMARAAVAKGRTTQRNVRRNLEKGWNNDSVYAAGFTPDLDQLAI